ncbi:hypothetical protein [Arthrobacter sp. M2012083]|uniref:hypothetical protein n=1 Tax=Arthrobacter sp. M2012083 TaxID=1197706 RepID=UPI000474DFC1|nr:hypothetical protein [Arthrobacter sp. M2012083]
MTTDYFRRQWSESRGDEHASWGSATYYFEVGDDGWPIRQIEIYEAGPTLRYGPEHAEDRYGQLSQTQIRAEDWQPWAISEAEFSQAWQTRD